MKRFRGLAVTAVAMTLALPAQADDHAFVLTGAGRFAVLADVANVQREGDSVLIRSFQVVEPDFTAGGQSYWGGWSWWRFDCVANTADRLDFASVREDGEEGPTTPEDQPPYAVTPGGDAAELLAMACASDRPTADVTTLEDAVTLGRAALSGDLAGDLDPPR